MTSIILPLLACIAATIHPLKKDQRDELFKVAENVFARYEKVGWRRLAEPEKTFYAVWMLEGEVNHGGFQYYYFYSGGDHALDAPAALRRIGALKLREILLKANGVFPRSKPPRDINKRQEYMDKKLGDKQHSIWSTLDDEVFKHPDPTEELLWAFFLKHKKHFKDSQANSFDE